MWPVLHGQGLRNVTGRSWKRNPAYFVLCFPPSVDPAQCLRGDGTPGQDRDRINAPHTPRRTVRRRRILRCSRAERADPAARPGRSPRPHGRPPPSSGQGAPRRNPPPGPGPGPAATRLEPCRRRLVPTRHDPRGRAGCERSVGVGPPLTAPRVLTPRTAARKTTSAIAHGTRRMPKTLIASTSRAA
jgi:hypothetical protein